MTAATAFPSMGATLFVGLTGVALITHVPPIEYADPRVNMTGFEATPEPVTFVAPVSWPTVLDPLEVRPALTFAALDTATSASALPASLPGPIRAPAVQLTLPAFEGTAAELALPPDAGDSMPPRTVTDPTDLRLRVVQDSAIADGTTPAKPVTALARVAPLTEVPKVSAFVETPPTTPALVRFGPPRFDAPTPQPDLPDAARRVTEARVTGDRVHLRVAPSINARSLEQYDTGTRALIRERRGAWRRVFIDGQAGWMFATYLSPNDVE